LDKLQLRHSASLGLRGGEATHPSRLTSALRTWGVLHAGLDAVGAARFPLAICTHLFDDDYAETMAALEAMSWPAVAPNVIRLRR
jgi:hypothetical protein